MLIVVEGADGVGKTTLVDKILAKFPVFIKVKMPIPDRECIEEYSYIFNHIMTQLADCNIICDRAYLSSLVYSEIFRRNYNLSYIFKLLHKIQNKSIFFILVRNKPFRADDDVMQISAYSKINKSYIELFGILSSYQYNVMLVNMSKFDTEKIFQYIRERMCSYVKAATTAV